MGISKAAFLFLLLLSSVKGDILDDYLRTDGVWILTRNKQSYETNSEKACAEKCEDERNFNCRAFLFTRKKQQCLTLAENTKTTVMFNSTDTMLYEKKRLSTGKYSQQNYFLLRKNEICLPRNKQPPEHFVTLPLPSAHGDYTISATPDLELGLPNSYTGTSICQPLSSLGLGAKDMYKTATTKPKGSSLCEQKSLSGCVGPHSVYLLQCKRGNGKDYRGMEAKTRRGIPCQKWAEKAPHKPNFTPEKHPSAGLEENYCRNPDVDENGPWCYTTDPATRFDYCNIPECEGRDTHSKEVGCMQCNGEDYHGKVSRTESGIECQHWDAQEPHMHGYTSENFPEKDLKMNFCRNPDGELRPWCFTTSPTKRWEYCDIPRCTTHPPASGPSSQCLSGNGEDYRGRIAITESGNACQHWNRQFPHRHGWIPDSYSCKGLEENYCRNPDGEKRPWCYTINRAVRWEYCAIPHCDETEQQTAGTDVPKQSPVPEECYRGKGLSYRGTTSFTVSGKKCQAWNSMFPHRHEKTPDKFPNADLRENYCRNPDADKRPWCFTTDPSVSWEYCSLMRCDDQMQGHAPNDLPATTVQSFGPTTPTTYDCINGNGKDYRGTIARTGTGRTCQEWSSQTPHSHNYFTPVTHPRAGLDKNYCRNPDGDVNGLWCFTTDPEKKWEYCEIPRCSSSHPDCGKFPMRRGRACEPYGMCYASPGSWPWHVSLGTSTNVHHCVGTLIHPQWVLTAAQCLQQSSEPSSYRVFLGLQNLKVAEPYLQIRTVQKLFKEPNGADIALLKMSSPVMLTDHVKPVCLPETNLMAERNTVCFLIAWGKARGTDGDNRLKDIEFPVLENRVCNRPEFLNGSVRNHEFCGGLTFGSIDYCEADAGGPLVCRDKDRFVQYGVTSWGLDCTQPSKPTVFVQIPSFVSWIKNVIVAH